MKELALPGDDLQTIVQQRLGLHIGSEMANYLSQNLAAGAPIPIIGCDARTGVPKTVTVDPRILAGDFPQSAERISP
ncbi:MAG: hypothetical protein ABSG31_03160 [Tepidisphaeraceae bacterium]